MPNVGIQVFALVYWFFNENLENDLSKRLRTHGILNFSKENEAKSKACNFMILVLAEPPR